MSTKARKRHSFVSNADSRTADGLCLLQHLVHHLELLVDAKQLPQPFSFGADSSWRARPSMQYSVGLISYPHAYSPPRTPTRRPPSFNASFASSRRMLGLLKMKEILPDIWAVWSCPLPSWSENANVLLDTWASGAAQYCLTRSAQRFFSDIRAADAAQYRLTQYATCVGD
jgi:hypothetical protein